MPKGREHWRSRLGIIFATSGSAIGLGTLWKLPYLVGQNGGGAFIALFLLFTLMLAAPLFIAELALGQFHQKSVLSIFSDTYKDSFLGMFGWLGIFTTILIASWYSVVSGWGLNYFLLALTDAFAEKSPNEFELIFNELRKSGGLNLLWQILFLGLAIFIITRGVKDGIERFSKVFFSLLFFLIIGLFIYAINLSGFHQALRYIIYPDFSKVDGKTILAAMGLSLFALSLGQGIMVTYGSYLTKKQDIIKTVFLVTISIVILSIIISLTIFPMVFSFGLPPESGEGLLFITLPYVTEQLPGSMLISAMFFALLIFAALTSMIGQIEVLVASLMEKYSLSRKNASMLSGGVIILVGLPVALMNSEYNPFKAFLHVFHQTYLEFLYVVIDWCLIIFSLAVCFVVTIKIGKKQIAQVLNRKTSDISFFICYNLIRLIVPISLIVICFYRFGVLGV